MHVKYTCRECSENKYRKSNCNECFNETSLLELPNQFNTRPIFEEEKCVDNYFFESSCPYVELSFEITSFEKLKIYNFNFYLHKNGPRNSYITIINDK